jgi:hypothetical protein
MMNIDAGRRILASGAVAGSAVALALASALPPAAAAPAASPSWHIVKQVHSGANGGFGAVTAAGKNTIWAFDAGNTPAAWRRTGSTWKRFAVPAPVFSASATSASNAWALTLSGQVLRWTGTAWAVSHVFKGANQVEALGPRDVWVFGSAWDHYNGRTWSRVTSPSGLAPAASALSDKDIWSFSSAGTVAHWNGHAFTRTSVKKLLPHPTEFSDPILVGIYAQSKNSIWAFGNGYTQDAGGPLIILQDNGHGWRRVVIGPLGSNGGSAVAPDGRGGLWIPLDGASGQPTTMAHCSGGKLTTVKLPVSGRKITLASIAPVPGTTEVIASGFTHTATFTNIVAVVLQYSP